MEFKELATLRIDAYENRKKIVEALTDSGYIVEVIKHNDSIITTRCLGIDVVVYDREVKK